MRLQPTWEGAQSEQGQPDVGGVGGEGGGRGGGGGSKPWVSVACGAVGSPWAEDLWGPLRRGDMG